MAVYRFSALRDGQALSFHPDTDFLSFDQSIISAADLRVQISGAHTHIQVMSGPQAGKDLLLLNTTPLELATSNVGFANGSQLLFGDDSPSQAGDNGDNLLDGSSGRDLMQGFGGNDTYVVSAGDVLADTGGIDRVISSASWNLGTGFENLTLIGGAIEGGGNSVANVITGNEANNVLNGRAGNDTLFGAGGNDVFNMSNGGEASYGADSIDGGDGADTVDFSGNARSSVVADLEAGTLSGGGSGGAGSATLANVENLIGGAFADRFLGSNEGNNFYGYGSSDTLAGANGNDTLRGADGDDWLYGGFTFATSGAPTGNDVLVGGAGRDHFVFNDSPNPFVAPPSATADLVVDFRSGTDELVFDDNVFPTAGPPGEYVAQDPRFFAGPGATEGHDSTDRVVYNTTTGDLYYDPDGSGEATAQIIATLQGHPTIAATDISII
jgi:Ca2+-binding RTX toxin-like protein